MDAITQQVLVLTVVQLLMCPIIVFFVKRFVGSKMDAFDERREIARAEQADIKRQLEEQRNAERAMVLAIARTMLLDNFEKCVRKGYYSLEEREVYSKLYHEYKSDNGNGVIDTIAERIRELPMEPPKEHED